ncbi:unnamed protein product [Heligmosomoides polygyrus]|uniref:Uncharacterized protein n=1 Tax=Heligmosomoides polygyrus TaxID=6339 RepID=A0A3P8AIF4_HELPZ|nr:unnamed protein product [Heligmosomoides polygyrus]
MPPREESPYTTLGVASNSDDATIKKAGDGEVADTDRRRWWLGYPPTAAVVVPKTISARVCRRVFLLTTAEAHAPDTYFMTLRLEAIWPGALEVRIRIALERLDERTENSSHSGPTVITARVVHQGREQRAAPFGEGAQCTSMLPSRSVNPHSFLLGPCRSFDNAARADLLAVSASSSSSPGRGAGPTSPEKSVAVAMYSFQDHTLSQFCSSRIDTTPLFASEKRQHDRLAVAEFF